MPLRGSKELFDINILPERFRRKRLTLIGILPWLLLLILLGTIYPTYTLAIQTQETFQENRMALARVQADLAFYQTTNQEQEELQSQLADALAQKEAIIQSYGGLSFSSLRRSPLLYQIHQTLPEGISWVQITQQNQTIRLDGMAAEYQLVIDLMDSLKKLGSLAEVEIDSIEQIESEETPFLEAENEAEAGNPNQAPAMLYSFSILTKAAGEVQP